MSLHEDEAFVTLCCNDAYAPGALVWAQSLVEVGTTRQIVVMITPQLSAPWRKALLRVAQHLEVVDILDSRDETHLRLLKRMELGITFTKLHCWRLTQYKKAVFMDADTLVLANIDDLFEREELSASPDPGWPDCFNSGVFVYRPSKETYEQLLESASTKGSFDGGDQGLLNMFFSDWARSDTSRRLPFAYNCICQAFYSYAPALAYFRSQVRVVHFIGPHKPWRQAVSLTQEAPAGSGLEFLQRWWRLYSEKARPHLPEPMHLDECKSYDSYLAAVSEGNAASGSSHGGPSSASSGSAPNERERQYAWERGEIDYTGNDRFQNIMAKLNVGLQEGESSSGNAEEKDGQENQ